MRSSGFDEIADLVILDELKKLPFCQEDPIRGCTYHEDIRAYLLSREEVRSQWQALNKRAASIFQDLLKAKNLKGSDRFQDSEWRDLTVEWLYHRLNVAPVSALEEVKHICAEALAEGQVIFCAEFLGRLNQRLAREQPNQQISDLKTQVDALLAYNNAKALPMLEDLVKLSGLTPDQERALRYQIGTIYLHDEDLLAPALEELEKAKKLDPDWVYICSAIAEVYYNTVAASYYLSDPTWGDYERALENAEIARQKAPDRAFGYVALGKIYAQQEEWQQAILQYEQAIEVEPDATDSYFELSSLYSQLGDVERAIAMIDKVTEVDSTASSYYTSLNKGNVYCAVRKYQQAIEQYEQAIAENPDLIDAYLALGDLYLNFPFDKML